MLSSRNDNSFCKYNGLPKGMVKNNHIYKVYLAPPKRIKTPYMQKWPPSEFDVPF